VGVPDACDGGVGRDLVGQAIQGAAGAGDAWAVVPLVGYPREGGHVLPWPYLRGPLLSRGGWDQVQGLFGPDQASSRPRGRAGLFVAAPDRDAAGSQVADQRLQIQAWGVAVGDEQPFGESQVMQGLDQGGVDVGEAGGLEGVRGHERELILRAGFKQVV
jgi:hypothetical protein